MIAKKSFPIFSIRLIKAKLPKSPFRVTRSNYSRPRTSSYKTYSPTDPDIVKTLRAKGVKIAAKPADGDPWWMVALVQWFPMLLLVAVWIFFMRQMQIGGGKAMSFGKSRAKLLTENTHKVTFADVAGIDEAKEELEEIIQFLTRPQALHAPRRTHSQGRPAGGLAGDRQNPARARHRR